MKPRVGVYLSKRTAARLTSTAKCRGATKSALVEAALDRFLESKDARDAISVADRLAELSGQIDQLDRDLGIVSEVVSLHARFHMTITPEARSARQHGACRFAQARFDERPTQPSDGSAPVQETLSAVSPQQQAAPGWRTAMREGARFLLEHRALIARVFLPFVAGYYLSYLFRTINALIAAPLTADLAIGAGGLGLLTSAYFLTFGAAQIPIGVLLDRYGPRRIQSALLIVAALGAALFASSDNFLLLLAGRAMMGFGVAAALTAGLKALVLWFPPNRVPLLNGLMIMLGALGAVTATSPADLLLASIGWRGLFNLFAALTAGCATIIYLVVPEAVPSGASKANAHLKSVYNDRRFWRLAPLSATSIGTAWALHGLWAAQWLTDIENLSRTDLVQHLFVMAMAVSLGALLFGVAADRLRRRGIGPQTLLGLVAAVSVMAQLALIQRWPLPSFLLWPIVAATGAATVLSYAVLAEYFPKELAGRANGLLNFFHIGAAFLIQTGTGFVLQHWAPDAGHYPEIAYQTAFALNLLLQVLAGIWFCLPSWSTDRNCPAPSGVARTCKIRQVAPRSSSGSKSAFSGRSP